LLYGAETWTLTMTEMGEVVGIQHAESTSHSQHQVE